MFKSMKSWMGIGLLIGMSMLVIACGGNGATEGSSSKASTDAKDSYVIQYAHGLPENAALYIGAERFKELVEEKSEGKIKVELHANGSLYASEREMIEATQVGNIEMTNTATAPLTSFKKEFGVLEMPFMFANREIAHEAVDGELGQRLFELLPDIGLKGLVYGETGMRNITNNTRPIYAPEDLKGIKIRTMENPVHINTFKEFGAVAEPFAWGEIYSALQQNVFDAQENPINNIYNMKFFEVQKYMSITNHVYTPNILLINNDFFEKLPEDLQKVVEEAAVEANDVEREMALQQDEEGLEVIKEHLEINELTSDQLQMFIDAAQPIYEKYESEFGTDLLELARSYSE